jgi:transposase
MNNITVLGIDLAKEVFQLHGVDKAGKVSLKKKVYREGLIKCITKLPKCLILIEACSSSHHWAREFMKVGHEVKMIAPQFVKPFVKTNKNDANDAEAIVEAGLRPNMRFVPIKTLEQQDMKLIHTLRSLAVKQRTEMVNEIRGILAEYGITLPQGINHVRKKLLEIIDNTDNELTAKARVYFAELYQQFVRLDERVDNFDKTLKQVAKEDERCQRLMKIEGFGPISATALVAAVGDAKTFKNGRSLSAWLGLVPKQHSSGGKNRLSGISKRGDVYLRTLLIHGARAVVKYCDNKSDDRNRWIANKKSVNKNKAAVALANKNARIAWVILTRGETYCPSRTSVAA